ncbi:MAG: hypothetical protein AMJ43_05865 [Coxiella sp. DG_40]|nr:MAG: hypothetical protein AMJ43_05865 [Coxiella sp. DG_40]
MTFKKGKSGNPQGRPQGIKDKRILFAEMLDSHKDTLFDKALELALAGNEQMLKLLLDRILPAKPKDNPLPEIGGLDGNVAEQCNKVMSLIANGIITPDEGNSLLSALIAKTKLVELNDVFKELAGLKQMINRTYKR